MNGVPDQDGEWLRQAMRLILADVGEHAPAAPLVLTVVAFYDSGDGGQLVQLTASARSPGRLYRKILDPKEIHGDGHPPGR